MIIPHQLSYRVVLLEGWKASRLTTLALWAIFEVPHQKVGPMVVERLPKGSDRLMPLQLGYWLKQTDEGH